MTVWTNVVFTLGLCLSLSRGELLSRHVCSNQSETSTSLECGHPGRIHLVRVLYRKTSPGCVTQDDTCEYLQETQKQGLRTDCQGASSCLQGISSFWLTDTCGPTTSYIVTLSYECVTDPSIDICSNTAVSSGAGYTLYLATPNYPRGVLNTSNTCACHVVGAAMNVYILGLFFRHREGDRATMTLRGENSMWNSHPGRYFVYNTQAMDSVDSLHLSLAANVKIGQHAWIKIESRCSVDDSHVHWRCTCAHTLVFKTTCKRQRRHCRDSRKCRWNSGCHRPSPPGCSSRVFQSNQAFQMLLSP